MREEPTEEQKKTSDSLFSCFELSGDFRPDETTILRLLKKWKGIWNEDRIGLAISQQNEIRDKLKSQSRESIAEGLFALDRFRENGDDKYAKKYKKALGNYIELSRKIKKVNSTLSAIRRKYGRQ